MLICQFDVQYSKMQILVSFIAVLFSVLMVVSIVNCYSLADAQRLKTELLVNRKYDQNMRPIFNQSEAIQVLFIIS